jgi:hypothetical protein
MLGLRVVLSADEAATDLHVRVLAGELLRKSQAPKQTRCSRVLVSGLFSFFQAAVAHKGRGRTGSDIPTRRLGSQHGANVVELEDDDRSHAPRTQGAARALPSESDVFASPPVPWVQGLDDLVMIAGRELTLGECRRLHDAIICAWPGLPRAVVWEMFSWPIDEMPPDRRRRRRRGRRKVPPWWPTSPCTPHLHSPVWCAALFRAVYDDDSGDGARAETEDGST